MAKAKRIFTVYDQLEFPEYEYKAFPKMLFHPKGELEVLNQGEIQNMPWGPEVRNRTYRMKHLIVQDEAEKAKALKAGWHESEAEAEEARGDEPTLKDLESSRPLGQRPQKPAALA